MIYQVSSNIFSTSLEKGMILLEADQGQYFELNQTGQFIFNHLKQGLEKNQIIELMAAEYQCTAQQADIDFEELLKELIKANLISVCPSS